MEQLEKGLIDFGLVFGAVDRSKYNHIKIPLTEVWGVLMRKDSPLAAKPDISPEDLWDKPLIAGSNIDIPDDDFVRKRNFTFCLMDEV